MLNNCSVPTYRPTYLPTLLLTYLPNYPSSSSSSHYYYHYKTYARLVHGQAFKELVTSRKN